jgi:hypothetical protein
MRSWKPLLSDKRWLLLIAIVAFALLASWCESRMRRETTPPQANQNAGQDRGGRRGDGRNERQPPRQLPDEFTGTTDAVEQPKPDPQPPLPLILRKVRSRQQADFDRVVFDFEGDTPPGFRVEYVDKLARKCGPDDLKVTGGTWLLVRMTPARSRNESGGTTLGGIDFNDELKVVKYMRQVCEAEGQVEWLIEVKERLPYRAEPLHDPARLVIDIKHPAATQPSSDDETDETDDSN